MIIICCASLCTRSFRTIRDSLSFKIPTTNKKDSVQSPKTFFKVAHIPLSASIDDHIFAFRFFLIEALLKPLDKVFSDLNGTGLIDPEPPALTHIGAEDK